MADDVTVIEGFGVGAAPVDYTLSGAQVLQVRAAFAKFDGSAASVPFLACIAFYAQDGKLFSRSYNPTPVAAGDTAEVSFAPFWGGLNSAGIRFDTHPQDGGFLYTHTAVASPVHGVGTDLVSTAGIGLTDTSNNGLTLHQGGDGGLNEEDLGSGGINRVSSGTGGIDDSAGTGGYILSANNSIAVKNFGANGTLIEDVGVGGMVVHSDNGTADFAATYRTELRSTAREVNVVAGTGITIACDFPIINLANGGTTEAVIQNVIATHGNYFMVSDNTPIEQLRLTPQGSIVLQISDHTGAAIFRVNDDGSLHGKTGKALTFDL